MQQQPPNLEHSAGLAAFCKAGGDPLRLFILRVLAQDSFGVLELAQIFAIRQSGMSHHLKVLAQAGLVATRREGNAVFYRRALSSIDPDRAILHQALLEAVDRLTLADNLVSRIAKVHTQRSAASREFFARKADNVQSHQALIAGLPQYGDGLLTLLDAVRRPEDQLALEAGPGNGHLLPALADRFQRVYALDNSPAMLAQAQHYCKQQQLNNVELQLADVLIDDYPPVDCIILNMVLHHLPAPGAALQHLARQIRPGGCLLLTELCSHDQSWVRNACGDVWLGFDQNDLTLWAQAAGLEPGESLYIGLKNGFQIQARHFLQPVSPVPTSHRSI